jgi:hypothetical protein
MNNFLWVIWSFYLWSFCPSVFCHFVFLWSLSPLTIFPLVIGAKCRYIWGYFSYYHRRFWQNEARIFQNMAAFNQIKRKLQSIEICLFLSFLKWQFCYSLWLSFWSFHVKQLLITPLVILFLVILSHGHCVLYLFCHSIIQSFYPPLITFSYNLFFLWLSELSADIVEAISFPTNSFDKIELAFLTT